MSAEALTTTIADIRARLGRREYPDESAVSQGIVMRLLSDLGWPVFDTTVVTKEYSIHGRRVDYALFGRLPTPSVLLEVKRVGNIEVGEEQLFQYAFLQGTKIIVLTDGRNWRLYLTTGEGSFDDRRFATVDLLEGDPKRGAATLRHYLSRQAVLDGQAQKRAEADFETRLNRRMAEEVLPKVWSRLSEDTNGPLVELLRSKVREECGTAPPAESVVRFLRGAGTERRPAPFPRPRPVPPVAPRPTPPRGQRGEKRRSREAHYSYTLKGDARRFRTGADLMVAIFTVFATNDAGFCERFAKKHKGAKLVYVARRPNDLYPEHPHLVKSAARKLPGGYFLGTHMGAVKKEQLIRWACEVAGVSFGRDLTIELPVASRAKKQP